MTIIGRIAARGLARGGGGGADAVADVGADGVTAAEGAG